MSDKILWLIMVVYVGTYGSKFTKGSRRVEFNNDYVTSFNKRIIILAKKLHS